MRSLPSSARRARPRPQVIQPVHSSYDRARAAWNVAADQRPAGVVEAHSAGEVRDAILFAPEYGLKVAPQTTGHLAGAMPSPRRDAPAQDPPARRGRDRPSTAGPASPRAPSGRRSSSRPPPTGSRSCTAPRRTSASWATCRTPRSSRARRSGPPPRRARSSRPGARGRRGRPTRPRRPSGSSACRRSPRSPSPCGASPSWPSTAWSSRVPAIPPSSSRPGARPARR